MTPIYYISFKICSYYSLYHDCNVQFPKHLQRITLIIVSYCNLHNTCSYSFKLNRRPHRDHQAVRVYLFPIHWFPPLRNSFPADPSPPLWVGGGGGRGGVFNVVVTKRALIFTWISRPFRFFNFCRVCPPWASILGYFVLPSSKRFCKHYYCIGFTSIWKGSIMSFWYVARLRRHQTKPLGTLAWAGLSDKLAC